MHKTNRERKLYEHIGNRRSRVYRFSHLLKLIENGYDIVVVDDLSNSHIKAIDRVKELAGRIFPFYEFDVCDGNKLDELFLSTI